jgi:choline dehydrogenase-like flavoprotein
MIPLPAPLQDLGGHYAAVVVGSDLAGAIVASRLARAGQRVAVLERRAELGQSADTAEGPLDPEPGYFDNPRLPAALRADKGTRLAEGIAAAREMLAGRPGHAARLCEAYLEDAVAHGAQVFAGVDVGSVEPSGERWLVKFDLPGIGRQRFDAPSMFVRADLVVLAAGPWAAQILGDSRSDGLPLSALLTGTHGCVMGEDAAGGVVDHRGRVFSGEAGTGSYRSLLVMGTSTLPVSMRPASTLGLAAVVERACALLAADQGWVGVAGAPAMLGPVPAPTVGLQFTESMRGFFSTKVTDPDYARGVAHGKDDGSSFVFVLTLIAEDVSVFLDAPDHPARSVGTVVAPALSPRPLMVAGGDFNLFVDQPGTPITRRMKYSMKLLSQEGRTFFMDGFKVIRDDPSFDVWADTTTLYITIYDGSSDQERIHGRGILRIYPEDFKRQLQTLQVKHAATTKQRVRAELGFARVFLGTLFDTYVGGDHLLPAAGRKGGIPRVILAAGAKTVATLIVLVLAWLPWRPAIMRQQPAIVAGDGPTDIPEDVAALGLFPQYLRGLDLRPGKYTIEHKRFRADWRDDNLVTDHGGLADSPVRPPDIRTLSDFPLRLGYMNLARVRTEAGQVVGIGSQVESVALDFPTGVLRAIRSHDIRANTTWSIAFQDEGLVFLSQFEGGPDIGATSAQAKKDGRTWRGEKRFNHTLGPLPGARGIVHGGTGAFAGVVGVFKEWNSLFEVPPQGIIHGATEWEIALLRAPRRSDADQEVRDGLPAALRASDLPPATMGRLNGKRPVRVVERTFEVDLGEDVIYRTRGSAGAGPVIPTSLGALAEPTLARVTAFMARLRDERGDIVGQAGAIRVDRAADARDGAAPPTAQWTLLFAGEGSVFIAMDEAQAKSRPPGSRGFFGPLRGVVVGGSGLYANAAGELTEAWPEGEGTLLRLRLRLLNDR